MPRSYAPIDVGDHPLMDRRTLRRFVLLALLWAGCRPSAPSDDPDEYEIDTGVEYRLEVGEPRWMVPSVRLPEGAETRASNNNVAIAYFEGRLFMGWRTAETHWASPDTKMHIVSSKDDGESWTLEHTIALGNDVREPAFLAMNGRLFFFFFEGGNDPLQFRPKNIWRIERLGEAKWSAQETLRMPGEIAWDIKERGGVAYMTSYQGNHYSADESAIEVYFSKSQDGLTWEPVDPSQPIQYFGGVSEVAFELDVDGSAWFVTRNEDGDQTGFGSHLCHAESSNLGAWDCPARSNPERYDSPELFRHGDDLYLVARRDVGGPFDQQREDLDFLDARRQYLLDYWTRPKRTAIYRIDRDTREVVPLLDLPSAGDTAFPSIRRTGPHSYLLANYTSPLDDPDLSWVEGQGSELGTRIYFVEVRFVAE
jgi:hypothetical protein